MAVNPSTVGFLNKHKLEWLWKNIGQQKLMIRNSRQPPRVIRKKLASLNEQLDIVVSEMMKRQRKH